MSIKYHKKEKKVKSSLSPDLGLNIKFTTLDLKSLKISDINEIEGLNGIPNLQVLDLSKNDISEIKGLENLTSLLKLNLVGNRISEITGLDNLTNLKILKLAGNAITEIKGLENLKNLEILEFGFRVTLRTLNLNSNQIRVIENLASFSKLKVLNLHHNKIEQIKGLENLTELQFLNLQSNNIQEIKGLSNLKKLIYLNVYLNPVYKWAKKKFKVAKYIFKNPQELVNYCWRNEKAKSEAIQYIKTLPSIYEEITFNELEAKTKLEINELKLIIENLILARHLEAKIKGNSISFRKEEISFDSSSRNKLLNNSTAPTQNEVISKEYRKKLQDVPLKVFLSYSTLDTNHFRISDIAKILESYPEIDDVLYWESDSGENIVEYMEKTLKICNIFVLFCSENSLNSKAVTDEWQAAFQLRKKELLKIIPVYENANQIPALLTPLLNIRFSKDNFIDFITQLYPEILRKQS